MTIGIDPKAKASHVRCVSKPLPARDMNVSAKH